MGAMKKLFVTCILVGAFVPLFQNCGQQGALHGNGDPYEDTRIGIPEGFENEIPDQGHSVGAVSRQCTGAAGAKIRSVSFTPMNATSDYVGFVTAGSNERGAVLNRGASAYALNITFDAGIVVKRMDVYDYSVKLELTVSGVVKTETLSCVFQ